MTADRCGRRYDPGQGTGRTDLGTSVSAGRKAWPARCGRRRPDLKDYPLLGGGPGGLGGRVHPHRLHRLPGAPYGHPRGNREGVGQRGLPGLTALPVRRRSACTAGMRMKLAGGRTLALVVAMAGLALAGCGSGSGPGPASASGAPVSSGNMPGPGMMGGGLGPGAGYHFSTLTCTAPPDLPGSRVVVTLGDGGMTQMMGGTAPLGAHMMLRAVPATVPAGKVSLVAENRGWRTHELVILPLAAGERVGQRVPGPGGTVDEKASLGEASASCGAGAGEGIGAGTVSWTTLTLGPGSYELICNLPNHYADGMYQELRVTPGWWEAVLGPAVHGQGPRVVGLYKDPPEHAWSVRGRENPDPGAGPHPPCCRCCRPCPSAAAMIMSATARPACSPRWTWPTAGDRRPHRRHRPPNSRSSSRRSTTPFPRGWRCT